MDFCSCRKQWCIDGIPPLLVEITHCGDNNTGKTVRVFRTIQTEILRNKKMESIRTDSTSTGLREKYKKSKLGVVSVYHKKLRNTYV